MPTWKRLILAIAAFIVLLLLFVTLILPGIIINRAEEWVANETGRSLTIGSLSINPFSLSVEVRALALSDKDQSKPFVTWDLLRVSLSSASLYHLAPVIDDLKLMKPFIHLERLTADTFNFSDLIPPKQETAPAAQQGNQGPLRFSVNNIAISDGRIELVDSSLEKPVHHTVSDLQLVLPSIGNLPYMVKNPAKPLFKAVVNDSPIDIQGSLKPFTSNQEMQFALKLVNIDLPFYLGYVPTKLPVDLRNGKLSLDLDITYRVSPETGSEVILSGSADLASLNIWDRQHEKLFFLPLLQVNIAPSQPLKQDIHLSSLRVYNLEVQLNRDQSGAWNHARMAEGKPAGKEKPKSEAPKSQFKLAIDSVEIRDGVVFFRDELPAGGFKSVAREINIDVKDFSLDTKQGIPFTLALQTDRKEAVNAKGHFQLSPFTLALQTSLDSIKLGAYLPYYQEFYNQPLGGTVSVDTALMVNPEQPLLISNGHVALRDLSCAFNRQEGVSINRFDVDGLSFDLARNRLNVDAVTSSDARASFSRAPTGEWSFLSPNFPVLKKPIDNTKVAKAGADAPPPTKASPFNYHVGEISIDGWQLDFTDHLPEQPARFEIADLTLNIHNLSAPDKVMSPFDLGMTLQRKGRVELKGETSLADLDTRVKVRLASLPLVALAPYVAEQTNLVLADGALNARLNARLKPTGGSLATTFGGDIGISKLHLLDGLHQEDLLKWDSLQIAGIKGDLTPFSLVIDSITLSDYFAKVLIDKEARLNLAEAFRKDQTGQPQGDTPQAGAPADTTSAARDIRIGKVVLQGGQVDFTDQSLPRPFHADMRELGGRIEGLDSSAQTRADVDLRGTLRGQSPLNITGTINPLAKNIYLDLELNFRDIDMPPFSPYSGNFVGYLIEKGKLNLALNYKLENNQLKASNKVFLDQFNFGESVKSENAINLPVKLAVALLKDGNGEIHLDIPVYGSLDDPQFSIAGVVWTVIRNLLVKAATSPLALLGAIIGGGQEDFSTVNFAYGSARLSTGEQDKLLHMAKALLDRPSLAVEISGFIDPEKDPEGYRREQLSTKIKHLKYLDLVKSGTLPEGTREEDVTVPPDEYEGYLWQVYRKADFPKPRNFLGITKELPPAEMEKLIYANTVVDDTQLAGLAQARAQAVQSFLTETGQLQPERIFLKEADITTPPKEETADRARVELGASVK